MNKLKTLAKDKRVITGLVVAIAVVVGVTLDPLVLNQIVEFIVSLTI